MHRDRILILTDDSLTQTEQNHLLPARDLFQGSFQEVRTFESHISIYGATELKIISDKYGLIDGNKHIMPYNADEIRNMAKWNIGKALMTELKRPWAAIVLLLKSSTVQKLLETPLPTPLKGHVIFVGADSQVESVCRELRVESSLYHPFRRVGVARIGRKNQEAIIKLLAEILA